MKSKQSHPKLYNKGGYGDLKGKKKITKKKNNKK